MDEGEEGMWVIKLIHDPDMLPHVRESISTSDSGKSQQVLEGSSRILSSNYISFFEFNLIKKTIGDRLRWSVMGAIDEEVPRIQFRSLKDGRSYHCGDPKKLLLAVFKNLLLMPSLGGKWQGLRVGEVSLSGRQFAYLISANADDFPGPVILDERPLGGAST